jgi:hypothetical protein
MTTFLTVVGTLIGALTLWWAHLRVGRLVFSGEAPPDGTAVIDKGFVRLRVHAHNTGVFPIDLKELYLRQDPAWPWMDAEEWTLNQVAVDGRAIDFRRSGVKFYPAESHTLDCEFFTTASRVKADNAFADLEVTEKTFWRERRRKVLGVRFEVGRYVKGEVKIAFSGSQEYGGSLRSIRKGGGPQKKKFSLFEEFPPKTSATPKRRVR